MAATSWWQIASPSPVPPKVRVVEASACRKGSKRCWRTSGAMPTPVSLTSTSTVTRSCWRETRWALMSTRPAWVNFTALDTRLDTTCPSRVGSPTRERGIWGSIQVTISSSLSLAMPERIVSVCSTMLRSSNSTDSSSSWPASILEKSRMSLMTPSRLRPAVWTPLASRRW